MPPQWMSDAELASAIVEELALVSVGWDSRRLDSLRAERARRRADEVDR